MNTYIRNKISLEFLAQNLMKLTLLHRNFSLDFISLIPKYCPDSRPEKERIEFLEQE
jgi:hypothetical protein